MSSEILRSPGDDAIRQFSIFADNKVGRLNDIIVLLAQHDIHILSLCTVDTTDSAIIRLIPDYWENVKALFDEHGYAYSMNEVMVVEFATEQDIRTVTCALTQTEINIHYTYPMLMRPAGKCGLVLHLEDNEMAADILTRSSIRVLTQSDLAR
ncbi:acetolactate synthase [Cerasicoccus arenae]|uniref:Acetolactate synthase n=1 Tax=Cerasicoccus arenae TaxID=424488 RepID=A0A8J3DJE5_9BACT|nr:acetolactate synthase [Cerasicoccus arenae]MBK1858387.1 acetolactate synthase [Cerasicoccus arenae]GHC09951.1 acetolactate synthase [Cerasicoccus arenae]